MKWEQYKEVYYLFNLSINQTMIASAIAGTMMEDFPSQLPEAFKHPILGSVVQLLAAVRELLSGPDASEIAREELDLDWSGLDEAVEAYPELGESPFEEIGFDGFDVFSMLAAASLLGIPPTDLSFRRLAISQALVMVLAHLNAFIADSLRAFCYAQPSLLRSQRKISWETVLSCRDWDGLLTRLIEEYVFKSGWQTVPEQVRGLRSRHGLLEGFPDSGLTLLEEAEQIRNVVIHNGGRASQEYLARTDRKDTKLGDFVPISFEYVDEVSATSCKLASWLFGEGSIKFFGTSVSQIGSMFDIYEECWYVLREMDS